MRASNPFVAALTVLALVQPLVLAQGLPSSPAPAAGGQVYGYYVPVVTGEPGETPVAPANYSLHLSDEGAPPVPQVSPSCPQGCSCDSCDGRGRGGCPENCDCLRCRHDRVFTRAFGSLEYLHWYNKGISLPPLVTTSPVGTPQAAAGVLPGATTIFGGNDIDDDLQAGGRLTIGWWLDDCCNLALTARLYGVENGTVSYTATSAGTPIIGRPFFNSNPLVNAEDALLVAFPGVTAGSVTIAAENDILGFEVMGRSLLDATDEYRLDLVGGYQFNRIDSDLAMTSIHDTPAADFIYSDLFDVDNEYHAGTLGLAGEVYRDCWTFSALGKIALGNMRQTVDISGTNTVTAGGSVTTPGGLFAQPTNIGTYQQDVLVWSPEANFKLSCAVTERIAVSVGYTFIYFTQVAFAGDQVDRNVNATQLNGGALVGPARPAAAIRDTDFWIQTVDLGVSFTY